MKYLILCVLLLSFRQGFCAPIDSLTLSNALQSNMVIQQNKPFKIWGQAKAVRKVIIAADWMSSSVEVLADEAGHFIAIIPVPQAKKGDFTAHAISITSGNEQIELENLLIGDLWICSGQSNMQFAVKEMMLKKYWLLLASPI